MKENEYECPECSGGKYLTVVEQFGEPGETITGPTSAAEIFERKTPTVRRRTVVRPCTRCGGSGRIVRLPIDPPEEVAS